MAADLRSMLNKTRDPFPAAKIRKERFGKIFNVWTKSHLLTLRWDNRRSAGHENVYRWFLNRYKWLLGPSKLRNCVFLGKCSKWNLGFQNWSNSLCLGVSEPTKRLNIQSTAYALRDWQGKQAFVKESEKIKNEKFKKWKKEIEICKIHVI